MRALPLGRSITQQDLERLVEEKHRESRWVEFKREYFPSNDVAYRKVIESINAFANTKGGDLIYGIEEQDGTANALRPLQGDKADERRRQVLELVRSHIHPPLAGVDPQVVQCAGGYALVVRVPQSWAGPHMVTMSNDNRFYIREEGRKRPMDYEEVMDAFSASEERPQKFRSFRLNRCEKILRDETPCKLEHPARIVIHVSSLQEPLTSHRFSPRELYPIAGKLQMLTEQGYSQGYDFDGAFKHLGSAQPGHSVSYVQIFSNGTIEAADSCLLMPRGSTSAKLLPSGDMEQEVVECVRNYISALKEINLGPPYVVFLSLLNVQGYVTPCQPFQLNAARPINRQHLHLREILIDESSVGMEEELFPVFNSIWNACGLPQSDNYDKQGKWRHR